MNDEIGYFTVTEIIATKSLGFRLSFGFILRFDVRDVEYLFSSEHSVSWHDIDGGNEMKGNGHQTKRNPMPSAKTVMMIAASNSFPFLPLNAVCFLGREDWYATRRSDRFFADGVDLDLVMEVMGRK